MIAKIVELLTALAAIVGSLAAVTKLVRFAWKLVLKVLKRGAVAQGFVHAFARA